MPADPTIAPPAAERALLPARARLPVFLITHEFHPRHGGIATFAEEIAQAAAGLGYDLEVWAQAAPPAMAEKPWPFRLRRLPLKGTHDLTCLLRLMREFVRHRRRLRDATVYLPEPGPIRAMLLLQLVPAFRPHRLVLTFHGSEILRFHRDPLARSLARRLIRRASRISVLTDYTRRLLCSRFPEAAAKSILAPGAARAGSAASPAANTREQRARTVILTVGRLHPRKGQRFIIEALQALPAAQRACVEWWLVGGNSKERYEHRLREAAGRSDLLVRFLGDVPDEELDRIYDQADIFAMTSIDHRHSVEGFGLVYLEAAAHGLPVIAHAIGGVPEAVLDGVTGLLVPPADQPALTTAFARLIADPALRHQLGTEGRQWARRHSWTDSAELLFGDAGRPSAA
ncbi:MAG TPA: glycosyltransferase family 4 protein [Opitutaceae bacterium]|nr:glycosyltransferase family 4 protein [Opitutaceae bacterium]